ncbi:hypothetical protein FB645_000475 [Coemansia sp. IMI 203386]|nr:hypothetical protein FB645_000475 [Coemansia sp. IMI 203386]
MIPELSSPDSTTTTAVSSPAFKQSLTNSAPQANIIASAYTTIASATSIPATGAGLHSVVGQLPIPQPSTFAATVSSTQSSYHSEQQAGVDPTLERLMMMGSFQAPSNGRPPGTAPSDMFSPMGFGSDVGIGSSGFFGQHNQPQNQSQNQNQNHTYTHTQTQATQSHQNNGYAQQSHGQLQNSPEQMSYIGWSHSSSLSMAPPQPQPQPSVSPPMWGPSYPDQRPLPTTVTTNRASPVAGSSHQVYPRAMLPHPSVQQPSVEFFNTMPPSYPIPMHAHSTSYLTATYPHAGIPTIPAAATATATTSFGPGFGIGNELRGMVSASSACTNLGGSDSDNISDNGSGSPGNRDSSANWKNQPRNSISRRQKIAFYQWLLENSRFPFPNENDRLGRLAIDGISEKKFKYWFANIRCRQFTKHRDVNGEMFFEPNAKFYESCLRLKLIIPHSIPVEIRRTIKRLNKNHQL